MSEPADPERRLWAVPTPTATPPVGEGSSGSLRKMRSRRTPRPREKKPSTIVGGAPPSLTPEEESSSADLRQRGRSELFVGPYDDADRYRLIDQRSHGGEGYLWRGALPLDTVEIPVAIKVIRPENVSKLQEWRERWQRQAELLRSCEHPGLVKVRDVFEGFVPHRAGDRTGSESLYLVMNWVEGPSVEQWVQMSPDRTTSQVIEVAGQIAAAVDHLHSGAFPGVSVLHRDIKPGNVVMSTNGALLVDFGFARLHSGEEMTMVGTPSYLAPEIVLGGRYGPPTDRYAFGGSVYFAFTGQRPDASAPDGMRSRLRAVEGFGASEEAVELVLTMLDPDPEARPTSCTEWVNDLRSHLGLSDAQSPRIYHPGTLGGTR